MSPLLEYTNHSTRVYSLPFCLCMGKVSFFHRNQTAQPSKHNKNLNSAGFQEMRKSVCGYRKNIMEEPLLV